MLIFSVNLGWLPISGRLSVGVDLEVITNFYLLDALLTANWEQELFGDAAGDLVPQMVSPGDAAETEPVLVQIPAGKADLPEPSAVDDSRPLVDSTHRSSVSWIIAGLVLVVMTILVGHAMKV